MSAPPKRMKVKVKRKQKDPLDVLQESFANFDTEVVEAWTVVDVVENFLSPLGLEKLRHLFMQQKITGHVLLTLTKSDLQELSPGVVGDIVLIDQSLNLLKRRVRKANRERLVWFGRWPDGGCAYYDSCGQCMAYTLFGWCLSTIEYKFTTGGIFVKNKPPQCNCCCKPMFSDHSDYRFMKDIEAYRRPTCLCACYRQGLVLKFDAKDDRDADIESMKPQICCAGKGGDTSTHFIDLAHPQLTNDVTQTIKENWQKARLVSD
eukprot:m.324738 g.324738  ORF g.324738 m.324738 type:complete len:262 (-) comp27634_c1_seq4:1947-2732(-)